MKGLASGPRDFLQLSISWAGELFTQEPQMVPEAAAEAGHPKCYFRSLGLPGPAHPVPQGTGRRPFFTISSHESLTSYGEVRQCSAHG